MVTFWRHGPPDCDPIGRRAIRPVLPLAENHVDLDHEDLACTHARLMATLSV